MNLSIEKSFMKNHENPETGDMLWCRLRPNRGMNKWGKKERKKKFFRSHFHYIFLFIGWKEGRRWGKEWKMCKKEDEKKVETLKWKWFQIERRLKTNREIWLKSSSVADNFYIFSTLQITFSSEDHWKDSSSRLNPAYRYGDIEAEKFQQTLMHIIFLTAKRTPMWMIIPEYCHEDGPNLATSFHQTKEVTWSVN